MRRLSLVVSILILFCYLVITVAGCKSAFGEEIRTYTQVYEIDEDSMMLSDRKVSMPNGSDPLSFAIRSADEHNLVTDYTTDGSTLKLFLDTNKIEYLYVPEILVVYSLVNTGVGLVDIDFVRFYDCKEDQTALYGGTSFIGDESMISESWQTKDIYYDGDLWSINELVELENIEIIEWLSETELLAIVGSEMVIYDFVEDEITDIQVSAESAVVSSDRRHLAVVEQGRAKWIFLNDLNKRIQLVDKSEVEAEIKLEVISFCPDSEHLLLREISEDGSTYYLYQRSDEQLSEINTNLDGYFVAGGGIWLNNSQIIFNVHTSSNENERGDLALYDLSEETFECITGMDENSFVSVLGSTSADEVIYHQMEEDLLPEIGLYRVNSTERTHFPVPAKHVYLSDSNRYALTSDIISVGDDSHAFVWIYEEVDLIDTFILRDITEVPRVSFSVDGSVFCVAAQFQESDNLRTFLIRENFAD